MSAESRERGEEKRQAIKTRIEEVIKQAIDSGLSAQQVCEKVWYTANAIKKEKPQERQLVEESLMRNFKNLRGYVYDLCAKRDRKEKRK
jgi:hypothetical protein